MATLLHTLVVILPCMIFGSSHAGSIISRNDPSKLLNGSPRYFEDEFNSTIECIRRYLIQGNPEIGLPPFDPLIFLEMKRLNIDNILLWTDLRLFEIVIEGLMSFETQSLTFNNLLQLDVEYHYKKIHLRTPYDGQINLLSLLTFDGQGMLEVVLTDVHIKTSTQYNVSPPLIDDYTILISLGNANITITGMQSEQFSHYLSILFSYITTVLVNYFQTDISDILSPNIKEFYNEHIGHLPFLDFLAIISDLICPV